MSATDDGTVARWEVKQMRAVVAKLTKERDDARAHAHAARMVAIEALALARDLAFLLSATPSASTIAKIDALAARLKPT